MFLSDIDPELFEMARGLWCTVNGSSSLAFIISPCAEDDSHAWTYCPSATTPDERLTTAEISTIEVLPEYTAALSPTGKTIHTFPRSQPKLLGDLTTCDEKLRCERIGSWCHTSTGITAVLVAIEPDGVPATALMLMPNYYGQPREFLLPFKGIAPNDYLLPAWQPDGSPMAAHATF